MRHHSMVLILLLLLCLLAAPAAAGNITNSAVSDTNIYAGSNEFNIGPAAEIDSTSSADSITSISGRYIYASALTHTLSAGYAQYSILNRQGAAVINATQGTALGMDWTYGDGKTATTDSLSHIYTNPGTYITTLQLNNYLAESDISLTTTVVLASSVVSDSTVSGTNIYADSNRVDIAPQAYNDGTNSASANTAVSGRYIYAEAISANVTGNAVQYTLSGLQGSASTSADIGTAQGYSWDYGDGTTGAVDTHTYAANGIYTVQLQLSNSLTAEPQNLSTRVQIGDTTISISLNSAEISTGGTWVLNSETQNAESVQWQVQTPGSTSWQNISGTTYAPAAYGEYQFRAIAYGIGTQTISDTVSGTYITAIQDCTVEYTNIYATGNLYSIAPPNAYATSSATGITNIANRYVYASALSAAVDGPESVYTISGLQGSTTIVADIGTAQGYSWDYGDGTTGDTDSLRHLYRASGTYTTTLQLSNYLDSAGVTLTANSLVFGPYLGNFEVDKTAGGVGDLFNFSVIALDATRIDWFYSASPDTPGFVISGEHGDTLQFKPGKTGYWYVKAKATNSTTGFVAWTEPIGITIWPSPVISQTAISPNKGPLTQTVTLSASVKDNAGGTKYQWQISSDGTTWQNITGATTATWIGSQTYSQAGKYFYRLIASGIGGASTSNSVAYSAYAPPTLLKAESSSSLVALPASITLTAAATDANTYTWQELRSGNWVTVGTGSRIYQQLSTAGIHSYRVVVSGIGGTTTSETIVVDAGYAPSVQIISPENGFKIAQNETFTVSASVSNADSYTWDFGENEHYETISSTSAEVRYPRSSTNVISISAVNKYGTSVASITVIVMYDFNRPTVNTPIDRLDSSDLTNWMESLTPNHDSQMPDIMGIFGNLLTPYTKAIGSWMYLILFAVPYLIIWIRQKNTIIPSILGVLFASWMLVQFPASAVLPAIGILILSISGGVYGIYVKFQR